MTTDWANEPAPGLGASASGLGASTLAATGEGAGFTVSDDWAKQTAVCAAPVVSDWAAEAPATPGAPDADPSNQWGGSSNWN